MTALDITLLYLLAAVLGVVGWLDRLGFGSTRIAAFALFVSATATFLSVVAQRTRGGWKWRWGKRD